MSIDIQIYGVHDRDFMIYPLREKLNLDESCVHYDDRPNGGITLYTAKKAWLAPIPNGVTHRVALADDIEVCNNFGEIVTQMTVTHPLDIISLFPYEFMKKNPEVENVDTPYFKAHSLFGAAIVMPVVYIEPCFRYIKEKFNDNIPDDDGILDWALRNQVRVLTTIPATVQHIGDESVLCPGRSIRRTEYFTPAPEANWGNKKVMSYSRQEWFFSNKGRPRKNKGVLKVAFEP